MFTTLTETPYPELDPTDYDVRPCPWCDRATCLCEGRETVQERRERIKLAVQRERIAAMMAVDFPSDEWTR